ncbi:MAG: response regulator, partial [Planctomycetota bacterium]
MRIGAGHHRLQFRNTFIQLPMASAITDRVNEPAGHPKEYLYIVDDETELLATLAQSLEAYGFQATTFERPEDLLACSSDSDVGCIISDLRMPGTSGIELIKQLKQNDSCLSVILLTAFADVSTAVDVMKLG